MIEKPIKSERRKMNETIYDPDKQSPRCSWLSEFLWICAGADRQVLRGCPTDHAKYAGIGGTILFTALMAWMSGGYALYSVFHNEIVAALFGLFWGLLIFNLDRFIVNTMYSDGKTTISWLELASGAPRIIMAIFLGIVISTPLELKIFEDEISITVEEMKQVREKQYVAQTDSAVGGIEDKIAEIKADNDAIRTKPTELYESEVHTGNYEIDNLNKLIRDNRATLNEEDAAIRSLRRKVVSLSNDVNSRQIEANNTYDTYQRSLKQKGIDMLIAQLSDKNRELNVHMRKFNEISATINGLQNQLAERSGQVREALRKGDEDKQRRIAANDSLIAKYTVEMDSLKRVAQESELAFKSKLDSEFNGFQAKLSAFNQMKETNSSTHTASIFIMLLFIIIETAPTFFKMMMEDGPYDAILNKEKQRIKVQCQHAMSDINDDINTSIRISTQNNELRAKTEADINRQAQEEIAKAQAEIIQAAINVWKQKQIEKAMADPEAFLKVSSPSAVVSSERSTKYSTSKSEGAGQESDYVPNAGNSVKDSKSEENVASNKRGCWPFN